MNQEERNKIMENRVVILEFGCSEKLELKMTEYLNRGWVIQKVDVIDNGASSPYYWACMVNPIGEENNE